MVKRLPDSGYESPSETTEDQPRGTDSGGIGTSIWWRVSVWERSLELLISSVINLTELAIILEEIGQPTPSGAGRGHPENVEGVKELKRSRIISHEMHPQ